MARMFFSMSAIGLEVIIELILLEKSSKWLGVNIAFLLSHYRAASLAHVAALHHMLFCSYGRRAYFQVLAAQRFAGLVRNHADDAQNWCGLSAQLREKSGNPMILNMKIYWHKGC
ncbi:MAG: hypothetical protein LBF51_09305 [Zoogloeaceae bacterium]|nr:hypothetical protein [Zoogloeaceae bacterium]